MRYDFDDFGTGKTVDDIFGVAAPDEILENTALCVDFFEIEIQSVTFLFRYFLSNFDVFRNFKVGRSISGSCYSP